MTGMRVQVLQHVSSEGIGTCANQAFQLDGKAIGPQIHLGTAPASAEALVNNCRDELIPGQMVHAEAAILSVPQDDYRSINRLMNQVLDYVTRTAG